MIDTIVLRIHGLNNYRHTINFLKQIKTKDYVKKFKHIPTDELTETAIIFGDTGRVLSLAHRDSIGIASSHYQISFLISEERDFIEFNFSLPKLLYTTNVMQFIDKDSMTQSNLYDRLIKEIQEFFYIYLPIPPEWQDVEIQRIDICYNQFFLSKEDALNYLNAQKSLSIEYAKSDANKLDTYGDLTTTTTIMQKTQNYSFKVYHKGTEFRKNDLSSLVKKNPMLLDLDLVSKTADKILRYELTCRNGLMNYLMKQRISKNENTMFHHHYEKMGKYRNTNSRKFIEETFPNKTFKFNLHSKWDLLNISPSDLYVNFNLGFTRELFDEIVVFFWAKVKSLEIGFKLSLPDIMLKIQTLQNNKKQKNSIFTERQKVDNTANLLLIAALSMHRDISELKNYLPKSTYFRYMAKLKELNIPKHTADIPVKSPELDYTTYLFYFEKYHLKGFQKSLKPLPSSTNFNNYEKKKIDFFNSRK